MPNAPEERSTTIFLGKKIGTHSSWDGDVGGTWWVYKFVADPTNNLGLGDCTCLEFNETEGRVVMQDSEGKTIKSFTLDWSLTETPRNA